MLIVSELNGVGVLQMSACKWIEVEILWSSGMPTRLSLGSLSLVLDLTMKNRPTLHKLVGSWSRSPDEPKAERNQSA